MEEHSKQSAPTITAVIPTFRRPRLLRRAINSVLRQSYPNFRIRVYDNASGDETRSVVESLEDPRISYVCHQTNIGAFDNFVHGLGQVDSDCFHLLSDDDVIFPHFYESAVEGLSRNSDAICFVGATVRAYADGTIIGAPVTTWRDGRYEAGESVMQALSKGQPEWTGIVFRSEVLSKVSFIDSKMGQAADTDFLFRVFGRFPIIASSLPCAVFLCHSDSLTMRGQLDSLWPGSYRVTETFEGLSSLGAPQKREARSLWLRYIRRIMYGAALKAALAGSYNQAAEAADILTDKLDGSREAFLVRIASTPHGIGPLARRTIRAQVQMRTWYRQMSSYNRRAPYALQVKELLS